MSNWNENTQYNPFDFVEYNGSVYMCVSANVDTEPVGSSKWVKWEDEITKIKSAIFAKAKESTGEDFSNWEDALDNVGEKVYYTKGTLFPYTKRVECVAGQANSNLPVGSYNNCTNLESFIVRDGGFTLTQVLNSVCTSNPNLKNIICEYSKYSYCFMNCPKLETAVLGSPRNKIASANDFKSLFSATTEKTVEVTVYVASISVGSAIKEAYKTKANLNFTFIY